MTSFPDALTMLDDARATTRDETKVQVAAAPIEEGARYERGALLGEGGMGEVRRCRDQRIGRDVAVKTVRAEAASAAFVRERFLREARVQGQLEHPCIVPVYDLGVGDDGAAYFTMKRVRGVTLEQVVGALRARDPSAQARWSTRKLLAAFATVCGAVEYAHARGVIHRDLKPGNVMLGDFGEVYVLDWGIARVLDGSPDLIGEQIDAPMPEKGRTAEGAVIGTLGYMPIEQLEGVADLDARADVYALGAMLFELLSREPLHDGDSSDTLVRSTLSGVEGRPSLRAPALDVPPELDAICAKATAHARDDRFASARELLDEVEHFLDGDRDLERRRELASNLAAAAAESASRALAGDESERVAAMRGVGRALALDAENPDALRTFVKLLVEPPRTVPSEVAARMAADQTTQHLGSFRGGAIGYAIWLGLMPLALWIGIRDVASFSLMATLVAVCGLLCVNVVRTGRYIAASQRVLLALSVAAVAVMGRMLGPFVLVPALTVMVTFVFAHTPDRTWRWRSMALGSLGMLAPAFLEVSGFVAPSYVFRNGIIELHARMLDLPALPTFASLVVVHLGLLMAVAVVYGRMRDAFDTVSQRLHLQTWQLRQIVPGDPFAKGAPVTTERRAMLG